MKTPTQLQIREAETHAEDEQVWGFIISPVPLVLPTFFAVAAPESALVLGSPFKDGEVMGTAAHLHQPVKSGSMKPKPCMSTPH